MILAWASPFKYLTVRIVKWEKLTQIYGLRFNEKHDTCLIHVQHKNIV